MLHHNVAVDEVGANPGGVEGGTGSVQEDNTHHVVANVTLLVHLCCGERRKGERGGRLVREGEKERGE